MRVRLFKKIYNQLKAFDQDRLVQHTFLREKTREVVPSPHAALEAQVFVVFSVLSGLPVSFVGLARGHESRRERPLNELGDKAGCEEYLALATLVDSLLPQVHPVEVLLRLQDNEQRYELDEVRLRNVQDLLTAYRHEKF